MNENGGGQAKRPPVGLRAQIDLPAPVATWVLAAHAVSFLTPLVLLWAVHVNWEYVAGQAQAPAFLYVAVALMMASAAFEIAQNTADRWYLLLGMGSTTRPGDGGFPLLHVQCAEHAGADHRLRRGNLVVAGPWRSCRRHSSLFYT